jgi:hypothetical protein
VLLLIPSPLAVLLAVCLLGALLVGVAAPLAYFPVLGDERIRRGVRERLAAVALDDAALWAIISRRRARERGQSVADSCRRFAAWHLERQVTIALEEERTRRHHRLAGHTMYHGQPLRYDLITWDDGVTWHLLEEEPALATLVLRGPVEEVYPGLHAHVCGHLPVPIGGAERRLSGLRQVGWAGEQAIRRSHWERAQGRAGVDRAGVDRGGRGEQRHEEVSGGCTND